MPTRKLTEKTLATLPAASTHSPKCKGPDACACALQDYYWDTETKGLGVVVGRSGVKTFVARAWVGGKKRRVKIGVAGEPRPDGHAWTVVLARSEAKGLLGRMSGGEDPNAGKRAPLATGPTLRLGLDLHLKNMREGRNRRRKVCSPRSIHKIETEVPRHLGAWLDRPIVELTADELERVCDAIKANTKGLAGAVNAPGIAQANKIIAHVSAIWNALDKRYDLPVRNPAKRLSLSALKPRETRIDDDGFVEWYAKVQAMENPIRRDLQLCSLFTGVRSEGVRNLRWEDVDGDRGLLHIRKAKGDKPYTLPLVPTVRAILDRRRTENASAFAPHGGDHGFVFPSLSRDMSRVQPVAEVKERRIDKSQVDEDGNAMRVSYLPGIHANRRTFNSVALEIGIPAEPREALMNHAGRGVNVKHYGFPQNWDYLRECAEKIEAALWQRLKPAGGRRAGQLRAV